MGIEEMDLSMLVHSMGDNTVWVTSSLLCNDSKKPTEALHDPGPANRNWPRALDILRNMEESMYRESANLDVIDIILVVVPAYILEVRMIIK